MNNKPKVTDALLMKHLLGETNEAEVVLVETWLLESDANRKQFEDYSRIWKESEQLAEVSNVDEDATWIKFLDRTKEVEKQQKVIKFSPRRNWLQAAAVLLLMITAGYFVLYQIAFREVPQIVLQSFDKVLTDTLPDGTIITLNKGATVSFPEDFQGKERLVKLQGEAFFDVVQDKNKPFIISANEAQVQVFGTSFNVNTTAKRTEVIVATGIVEVSKNSNAVKLVANEKAVVTVEEKIPLKAKYDDHLYQYYVSKEFVLNATPLWRFVDVLSQAYNVQIVIENESIKDMRLTTVFRNESLQNILVVLGETLNITIEQKGSNIILR